MRIERQTAAILNEPLEFFSVPRLAAGFILAIVAVLWHYVSWKVAGAVFVGATLGVKEIYKLDRDLLRLSPAIAFFYIHRVFDPFEWEPFQLIITEDQRYEEE